MAGVGGTSSAAARSGGGRRRTSGSHRATLSFFPVLILLLSFLVFFAEVGASRSLDSAGSMSIIPDSAVADQGVVVEFRQQSTDEQLIRRPGSNSRKLLMIHTDDYHVPGANPDHDFAPPGSTS